MRVAQVGVKSKEVRRYSFVYRKWLFKPSSVLRLERKADYCLVEKLEKEKNDTCCYVEKRCVIYFNVLLRFRDEGFIRKCFIKS
jgi:hypothetical protein